jgi:hypothetical protein
VCAVHNSVRSQKRPYLSGTLRACRRTVIDKKVVELQLALQKREAQLRDAKAEVALLPPLKIGVDGVRKLTEQLEEANARVAELERQLARAELRSAPVQQVREPAGHVCDTIYSCLPAYLHHTSCRLTCLLPETTMRIAPCRTASLGFRSSSSRRARRATLPRSAPRASRAASTSSSAPRCSPSASAMRFARKGGDRRQRVARARTSFWEQLTRCSARSSASRARRSTACRHRATCRRGRSGT